MGTEQVPSSRGAHPNTSFAYESSSTLVDPPFPHQKEMTFPPKQGEGE